MAEPVLEIVTEGRDSVVGGFSDEPHVAPESDVIGSVNDGVVESRPRFHFQHPPVV